MGTRLESKRDKLMEICLVDSMECVLADCSVSQKVAKLAKELVCSWGFLMVAKKAVLMEMKMVAMTAD